MSQIMNSNKDQIKEGPKQPGQNKESVLNNFEITSPIRIRKKISDLCCQIAFNRLSHSSVDLNSPSQMPNINSYIYRKNSSKRLSRNVLQQKFNMNNQRPSKDLEQYQRMVSYIRQNDWKIDQKKGGAILFNKDKKSIISKLITYICKRVISTGSFMGISFPTFGMKPETILETYCKCLGPVPLILQNISDEPLQRIKAFNAIILSISLQFNDIQKPFNPTLGQTFQGQIGGYKIYAEQVCHHPPITSFILYGKNYVFHATLELNASLGMNSAVGMFYGQLTLQFEDGGIVKGRMPNGLMSGMMFGETKFTPEGACYSYDPVNKIVCSYYVKQKDIFVGQIGKLLPSAEENFFKLVNSNSKQKYEKFKHIPQKEYQTVLSRIQAIWSKRVSYDGDVYFDFKQPKNLPIKLTQNVKDVGQILLKSDSSWRQDIKLRSQLRMDQSQRQKQKIQDEERFFRKLRQKFEKEK